MGDTIGVIAAGGKGQRLASLSNCPKALKQIAGFVLLQHTVLRFARAGLQTIYLLVRYQVSDFLTQVAELRRVAGVEVQVVPLGVETFVDSPINDIVRWLDGGGASAADNLFVSYCDVITDFDLRRLLAIHLQNNGLATMLLFMGDTNLFVHKYILEPSGSVSIIDTGAAHLGQTPHANGGIYIVKRSLLDGYSCDNKIYFSERGGPIEIASARKRLFGAAAGANYFMEIGRPEAFSRCEQDLVASESLRRCIF